MSTGTLDRRTVFMEHLNLVSGLEEEFSFKVPDADLNPRKFDSIARIETYLSEHAAV